jgi:osmotically-inducible protein OsmY
MVTAKPHSQCWSQWRIIPAKPSKHSSLKNIAEEHVIMILRSISFIFATMLLAGSALADAFDDPKSVGWKFRYGLTDAEYTKAWNDYKKAGYLPIDVETDDGGKTYAGVWQENTDGRAWASWRRLSDEAFHQKWEEYRKKGDRKFKRPFCIGATVSTLTQPVKWQRQAPGRRTARQAHPQGCR